MSIFCYFSLLCNSFTIFKFNFLFQTKPFDDSNCQKTAQVCKVQLAFLLHHCFSSCSSIDLTYSLNTFPSGEQ